MSLNYLIQIGIYYIVPFLGLPLLGVVIGAWLTTSFFPFRLKRREWRWEKEQWARELLFETVSRVSFIADHYLKGRYDDRFSMSELSLEETNKEITRLIKELHFVGHKLRVFLTKHNAKVFDEYLRNSQVEYDAAKDSWNQWQDDDETSPIQHAENVIANQGRVATEALRQFKLSS